MKRSRFSHHPVMGRRTAVQVLAWAFLAGLLSGLPASAGAEDVFCETKAAFAYPAGIAVFISPLLPLLFSGFAVYVKRSVLLVPAAFWRAFLFSYAGSGIIRSWGQAGWLVGGLAQFGSFCSLPVLWWYWLRHIGGEAFDGRTLFLALGAALLIGWVDAGVISPFLSNILTF